MMTEFANKELYDISVTQEHPRVTETCLIHLEHMHAFEEKHALSQHTQLAFQKAWSFVDAFYGASSVVRESDQDTCSTPKARKVILDSGCGTGLSTRQVAAANPDLPVIGVDRSMHRLSKQDRASLPHNALLLRAELVDFWLLANAHPTWKVEKHFLLYPNPYPKARHLKRRFPGHPVLPWVVALGGELVLRSNWEVYCLEFATALRTLAAVSPMATDAAGLSGATCATPVAFTVPADGAALTHFERKYAAVGADLFELRVQLGIRTAEERFRLLQSLRMATPGSNIKAEVVLARKCKREEEEEERKT
jgi:tRNA G46 methylase TrmB